MRGAASSGVARRLALRHAALNLAQEAAPEGAQDAAGSRSGVNLLGGGASVYADNVTPTEMPPKPTRWPQWVLASFMVACLLCASGLWYMLRHWMAEPVSEKDVDLSSNFMGGGTVAAREGVDRADLVHRIPWEQYFALGFWYCLLLANAAFTRLWCYCNIPLDCHSRVDSLRGIHSLDTLLKDGFIIAVLTGVMQKDRFAYLFNFSQEHYFRGALFLVVFFATSPVFGSLDLIPALSRISLTTGSAHSQLYNFVIILLALGGVALVLFHVVWAAMHNPLKACVAYLGSRLVVWVIYAMYFVEAGKITTADFHLHHYMVGYLIAILAEFNHPVSLLLLAIGTGIFVQGLAAYNADPLIYHTG